MNVSFRKITETDLPFLNETRNIYAEEFLHDSRTFSLDETIHWFKTTNPDYWIIRDDDINETVGYFRLSNYSKANKNIYIGADIAPKFRRKGYATAAYKKFIPLLFGFYDLNKISLEVLSTNTNAIKLYEKLGFIKEGEKCQDVLKKSGWVNSIIMSLINPKNKIVSLVIAAYFGERHVTHPNYNADIFFYIKKNMEYINRLSTNIHKIYITCAVSEKLESYKILNKLRDITHHDPRIIIYPVMNFGGSYSAWEQIFIFDDGRSDYIVHYEDDYVLYDPDSIQKLLDYWKHDDNLFSLVSVYACNWKYPIHAAISNGIINVKMYNDLRKKFNIYFDLVKYSHNPKLDLYNTLWHNQFSFLKNHAAHGCKIIDFKDKHAVFFSDTGKNYGQDNNSHIFCPITPQFVN
jgi:RimJ/RimL family protein N-acetyltransferase